MKGLGAEKKTTLWEANFKFQVANIVFIVLEIHSDHSDRRFLNFCFFLGCLCVENLLGADNQKPNLTPDKYLIC